MKRCPKCNREESDDSLGFCRIDGTSLISEATALNGGEAATQTLPLADRAISTEETATKPTAPTTVLHTNQTPRNLLRSKVRATPVLLTAAIVIIIIGSSAYLYKQRTRNDPSKNSIAVLPFLNASGDPNMEYLSDGISESLINSLSQLPNIRVIARSTTFSFKGKDLDPSAIGRHLGVTTVLTGRIAQLGDNLSVQADLVDVSDGRQLWGERYSRKATDLLSVEQEIARRIVDHLSVRLNTAERGRLAKRYTENIEAYRTYLRGRYEWNKRTGDGLNKAVGFFNQAIALDPAYSLAHAGLADSYALLPQFDNAPFEPSLMKAKASSLKALELDDSLAEAHISLANVKQSLWDWEDVEDGFKRGLDLNTNYATGHQWYSEYLILNGRIAEGEREIRLAQQLDPMSLVINVRVGMTAYFASKYDQAEKQLRETLQFDPDFVLTNLFLFNSLYKQSKNEESIPYLVKGYFNAHLPAERAEFESAIRSAYAKAGEKGMFETVRDLLLRSQKRDYAYPMVMAQTLFHLGDYDGAFDWLNRAAEVKHPGVTNLRVDPLFEQLRRDPRLELLMKRVGI